MLEHRFKWRPDHSAGEQPFEIILPGEPCSCQGRLITLKWELELRAHRIKESFKQEIVVSTTEQCVKLSHVGG
jgi:hypothetical protein